MAVLWTSYTHIMSRFLQGVGKLKDTKEDIRQAIIEQGIDVPEDLPFSEYPDKIKEIQFNTDDTVIIGPKGAGFDYSFTARCESISIENRDKPFKHILIYGDKRFSELGFALRRISGSHIGIWSQKGQAKRCSYQQTSMTNEIKQMAIQARDKFKNEIVTSGKCEHLIVTYSDGGYKFAFLPKDFKIVNSFNKTQYNPPTTQFGTSYFRIEKAHVVIYQADLRDNAIWTYRYYSEGSFDQIANIVYSSLPLMCDHVQIWPDDPNVSDYDYGGCPIL